MIIGVECVFVFNNTNTISANNCVNMARVFLKHTEKSVLFIGLILTFDFGKVIYFEQLPVMFLACQSGKKKKKEIKRK